MYHSFTILEYNRSVVIMSHKILLVIIRVVGMVKIYQEFSFAGCYRDTVIMIGVSCCRVAYSLFGVVM